MSQIFVVLLLFVDFSLVAFVLGHLTAKGRWGVGWVRGGGGVGKGRWGEGLRGGGGWLRGGGGVAMGRWGWLRGGGGAKGR